MAYKRVGDMTPEEYEEYKRKRTEYRNRPEVKEMIKKHRKTYKEKHREEINVRKREYYHKNIERMHEKQKEYYEKNREKILAYNKKYLATHPEAREKQRLKDKECKQRRGPEYMKQYMKNYRANNKNNYAETEREYNLYRGSRFNAAVFVLINTYNNKVFVSGTTQKYKIAVQKLLSKLNTNKYNGKRLQEDYNKYKQYFKTKFVWAVEDETKLKDYVLFVKLFYSKDYELYDKFSLNIYEYKNLLEKYINKEED